MHLNNPIKNIELSHTEIIFGKTTLLSHINMLKLILHTLNHLHRSSFSSLGIDFYNIYHKELLHNIQTTSSLLIVEVLQNFTNFLTQTTLTVVQHFSTRRVFIHFTRPNRYTCEEIIKTARSIYTSQIHIFFTMTNNLCVPQVSV